MSDNEKIAKELLEKFEEHYKQSPTVMKPLKRLLKKCWDVKNNERTTQ